MGKINWKFYKKPQKLIDCLRCRWSYLKLCARSLTHNAHMNASYATDVCMEPLIWVVDNYTHLLGPFLLVSVICLTVAVVVIAYCIGLPFWWEKNPKVAVFLIVVGNWLLLNVVFHYAMAVYTPAGYPPKDVALNAVTMCRKCILPKPARTHHCSVCNKCILKMDHHCPWINNCVGFFNHRYFFLYMVYTCLGCIFLMSFGVEIGYRYLWMDEGDFWVESEPLQGHPLRFNLSGYFVPVTHSSEYDEEVLTPAQHSLPTPISDYSPVRRRALVFEAITVAAVLIALGTLCVWHAKLVTRGETSIEARINDSETRRHAAQQMVYVNPYNFGAKKNWKLFLGLVRGRSFLRAVLLPSWHKPEGDGLHFYTVHDLNAIRDEWP